MTRSFDGLTKVERPPLTVHDHLESVSSGPKRASAIKIVFMVSGCARVKSASEDILLETGSVLVIPSDLEYEGTPLGHARAVTLYFCPDYVSSQLRWLPSHHPLVHHLHRSITMSSQMHTLQLALPLIHSLTPRLVALSQLRFGADKDFALLSITSEVFDLVGRYVGSKSPNIGSTAVMPRKEVITAIALLRNNLRHSWRVEELSSMVSLSTSQLSRV